MSALSLVSKKSFLTILIILGFIAATLFIKDRQILLFADSADYRNFAQSIINGKIFQTAHLSELSFTRAVRTPAYPVLIAPIMYLFPENIDYILFAHLAFTVAVVITAIYFLRSALPVSLALATICATLLLAQEYFWNLLTEWMAMSLVLLFLASVIYHLHRRTTLSLFFTFLICSVATLTRPSLGFILPIPLVLALFTPIHFREKIFAALSGLLPMLLWMSMNYVQLGVFSLTALGGYNFLGNVAMANSAPLLPTDPPKLQTFTNEMNRLRCVYTHNSQNSRNDEFISLGTCFTKNLNDYAMVISQNLGLNLVESNEAMWVYAKRAALTDPIAYLKQSMQIFWLMRLEFLLMLIAAAVLLIHVRFYGSLWETGVIAVYLHVANLIVSCVLAIPHDRYIAVTHYPLILFGIFLPAVSTAFSAWMSRRSKLTFEAIYTTDAWTRGSGPGSDPHTTQEYQQYLQNFLKEKNITSVIDLGCGDWQLAQTIDWKGINYLGIDIVSSVIKRNCDNFESATVKFTCADISTMELPPADLAIIKDVFQHWPNSLIKKFLASLKEKYRYVLITNCAFDNPETNAECTVGGFRPLNLLRAPFNLHAQPVLQFRTSEHAPDFKNKQVILYPSGN